MRFWKYIISLLFLGAVAVWFSLISFGDENLHIVACNVGQGDAILVYQGKTQILFDGGPDNEVFSCLAENIPFWDKEIEVVILTHPETDHYKGLIDVFRNYRVQTLVAPSLDSSSQNYQVLEDVVKASQARIVNPKDNIAISTGLIYLDILWPTQEYQASKGLNYKENVLGISAGIGSPNELSIVAILRLKEFSALFTGDITPEVAEIIVKKGLVADVDYIKVPHHGSKNGLTKSLLLASSPEVGVISAGENNSYGHPHEETISMLEGENVLIKRTDLDGDIEVVSDGYGWWFID